MSSIISFKQIASLSPAFVHEKSSVPLPLVTLFSKEGLKELEGRMKILRVISEDNIKVQFDLDLGFRGKEKEHVSFIGLLKSRVVDGLMKSDTLISVGSKLTIKPVKSWELVGDQDEIKSKKYLLSQSEINTVFTLSPLPDEFNEKVERAHKINNLKTHFEELKSELEDHSTLEGQDYLDAILESNDITLLLELDVYFSEMTFSKNPKNKPFKDLRGRFQAQLTRRLNELVPTYYEFKTLTKKKEYEFLSTLSQVQYDELLLNIKDYGGFDDEVDFNSITNDFIQKQLESVKDTFSRLIPKSGKKKSKEKKKMVDVIKELDQLHNCFQGPFSDLLTRRYLESVSADTFLDTVSLVLEKTYQHENIEKIHSILDETVSKFISNPLIKDNPEELRKVLNMSFKLGFVKTIEAAYTLGSLEHYISDLNPLIKPASFSFEAQEVCFDGREKIIDFLHANSTDLPDVYIDFADSKYNQGLRLNMKAEVPLDVAQSLLEFTNFKGYSRLEFKMVDQVYTFALGIKQELIPGMLDVKPSRQGSYFSLISNLIAVLPNDVLNENCNIIQVILSGIAEMFLKNVNYIQDPDDMVMIKQVSESAGRAEEEKLKITRFQEEVMELFLLGLDRQSNPLINLAFELIRSSTKPIEWKGVILDLISAQIANYKVMAADNEEVVSFLNDLETFCEQFSRNLEDEIPPPKYDLAIFQTSESLMFPLDEETEQLFNGLITMDEVGAIKAMEKLYNKKPEQVLDLVMIFPVTKKMRSQQKALFQRINCFIQNYFLEVIINKKEKESKALQLYVELVSPFKVRVFQIDDEPDLREKQVAFVEKIKDEMSSYRIDCELDLQFISDVREIHAYLDKKRNEAARLGLVTYFDFRKRELTFFVKKDGPEPALLVAKMMKQLTPYALTIKTSHFTWTKVGILDEYTLGYKVVLNGIEEIPEHIQRVLRKTLPPTIIKIK